jgi:hypothetical protein
MHGGERVGANDRPNHGQEETYLWPQRLDGACHDTEHKQDPDPEPPQSTPIRQEPARAR